MSTQFSRSELLLGPRSTAILAAKIVAVFGLGGVGSYAVEGLARSGIGHFVLFDHDCVSLSNVNRQLIATLQTVGLPKVELMRDRILAINPSASVEIHQCFYGPDTAVEFGASRCAYIVDCIDTVSSKILLVEEAFRHAVPILSCMGTGNKLDPTRFEIADIGQTSVCPLARVMRRELKRRGIEKLKVLYSREIPVKPENPGFEADAIATAGSPDLGRGDGLRRSVPGSVPFVPPVAGLIIAGEVIKDLLRAENA